MSNLGLENFFSIIYIKKRSKLFFLVFANLGTPLELGARGKLPPVQIAPSAPF
jgi:hypothetical protein